MERRLLGICEKAGDLRGVVVDVTVIARQAGSLDPVCLSLP